MTNQTEVNDDAKREHHEAEAKALKINENSVGEAPSPPAPPKPESGPKSGEKLKVAKVEGKALQINENSIDN